MISYTDNLPKLHTQAKLKLSRICLIQVSMPICILITKNGHDKPCNIQLLISNFLVAFIWAHDAHSRQFIINALEQENLSAPSHVMKSKNFLAPTRSRFHQVNNLAVRVILVCYNLALGSSSLLARRPSLAIQSQGVGYILSRWSRINCDQNINKWKRHVRNIHWSGRFLGIRTGWDPRGCKSNQLHEHILWFSFITLG